jgi:hypothetical protein
VTTASGLAPWIPPTETVTLAALLELPGNRLFSAEHTGVTGVTGVTSASAADLPTGLRLNAKDKLVVTAPVTSPANRTKWNATITPKTGAVTGSFILSDIVPAPTAKNPNATRTVLRTVPINGVLRQPHGTGGPLGAGQIIVPALPTDSTTESVSRAVRFVP